MDEAERSFSRTKYEVVAISMDVQVPKVDGLEATRQIRAQWPLAQQPHIIAMTANAMQGDRELCLAAGMNDYVGKPVYAEGLYAALQRAARARRRSADTILPSQSAQMHADRRGVS